MKQIFKVGQKVKCIGSNDVILPWKGGTEWKENSIFIIDKIGYDNYRNQQVCWRKYGSGVYGDFLKIIDSEWDEERN